MRATALRAAFEAIRLKRGDETKPIVKQIIRVAERQDKHRSQPRGRQ